MTTGIKTILFMIVLFSVSTVSNAQNYGKIAGTVTDESNGDALIGASVVVVGTTMGASADVDGNYNILSVPPGTYTLKYSYTGYQHKLIQNVKVSSGLTSRFDVKLSEETIMAQEIVVTAERPMVTKDLTASTAIVSGDQIQALPVTEVSQIVSLSAGNVSGHFRGGRSSEVSYMIDGVPVTDKFDGSQVAEVNKNMVSELQVISGAFNAEYGQAMSAIINVATKDGNNQLNGSFTTYFGDYMTTHDDIFLRPSFFNPLNIQNYEGTLSGPIIRDNLYFFAVARYINFGGHLYGERRFNPDNILTPTAVNKFSDPGDGKIVNMNNSSKITLQNKFTWPIFPGLKASLNAIYENREWHDFDKSRMYNPDGRATNYQTSTTGIFSLTHALTANTFYTLSGSAFLKDYNRYAYKGLSDNYVNPNLGSVNSYSFSTGGVDMGQFRRETQTFSIKGDILSQVTNEHQVKAGFDYKFHNIVYDNRTVIPLDQTVTPYITPVYLDRSLSGSDYYKRNPKEFSLYVQDKMEFSSFILNVGVRFDWFDPAGKVLNDVTDPNIYFPLKDENRFNDLNDNGKIDENEMVDTNLKSVAAREAYWWKNTKSKYQISPRIGAAFPITDQGKIYFSYGLFYQFPNFENLYRNADFKFGQGSGNQGVAGNSDLKPEQNTSMEIGLSQQLSENLALDATAYFRDYRDLSGTRADEIIMFGGTRTYSQLVNSDFAFIRGFILSLNQRMTNNWGVTVDYTYQIAKGTASDPDASRNALAGGILPEVKLNSLDWDQTHTLNSTVNYDNRNWGASAIMTFGTGLPYTPRQSLDVATILTNSEVKPSTFNVDVRAYYNIELPFGSMTVFGRIYNLFDTLNEYGVFDDSGRAGYTKDQVLATKINPELNGVNTLNEYFNNPQFYSEPRRLEFGFTYNF